MLKHSCIFEWDRLCINSITKELFKSHRFRWLCQNLSLVSFWALLSHTQQNLTYNYNKRSLWTSAFTFNIAIYRYSLITFCFNNTYENISANIINTIVEAGMEMKFGGDEICGVGVFSFFLGSKSKFPLA